MNPLIINDTNYLQAIHERLDRLEVPRKIRALKSPQTLAMIDRGCKPRVTSYGTYSLAPPADETFDPIPRSLWSRLIAEGQGTFLGDLIRPHLPAHDQGNTNYCWAHGAVYPIEAVQVYQGLLAKTLSAESIAVPITGGTNRGGYPEEAITRLATHGACSQDFWPLNDRNIRHAKNGWQDDALNHRLVRFLDVHGFAMQLTMALQRIPIILPLNWWGHEVAQLDPIDFGHDDFGVGCMNSWGTDYGDQGYFLLTESKATAESGAFAVLSKNFPKPNHV